jgi:hypothetical protein
VFCHPNWPIIANGERRKKKLPERSGRGAGTEGHGAPLTGQELGECADHQRERTAAETETDQHTRRQVELKRRCRVSHPDDAGHVEHGAAHQHPGRAKAVGKGAGERLRRAPQQHLDGEGKREHVAAPAVDGRSSASGKTRRSSAAQS